MKGGPRAAWGPSRETATPQGHPDVGKCQPPPAGSSLPQALCHTQATYAPISGTTINPSVKENGRPGNLGETAAGSRQARMDPDACSLAQEAVASF